jgi:hypothetical protein
VVILRSTVSIVAATRCRGPLEPRGADVCLGWTEAVPLLAREQSLVVDVLDVIRRQSPVPICGIDWDNDSAFINETLLGYCQQQRLEFKRARAYLKNAQAWSEQTNGAVLRRFVGYGGVAGVVAGCARTSITFSPPSGYVPRHAGAPSARKTYARPVTPCEGLLGHACKRANSTFWTFGTRSAMPNQLSPRWHQASRKVAQRGRAWSARGEALPAIAEGGSTSGTRSLG